MAYEQKPGELVIFKNDKKTTDNQPDYKGKGIDLNGEPIEIALWVKQGKEQKFFSAKIQRPLAPKETNPFPNAFEKEEPAKPVDKNNPFDLPF